MDNNQAAVMQALSVIAAGLALLMHRTGNELCVANAKFLAEVAGNLNAIVEEEHGRCLR